MRTWLIIIITIILIVLFVILVSFLSSMFILNAASKYLDDLNNTYNNQLLKLMPKKDCQECGYENCDEFVNELLSKRNNRTCPYCNEKTNEKIDKLIKDYDLEIENLKIQNQEFEKKYDKGIFKRKN